MPSWAAMKVLPNVSQAAENTPEHRDRIVDAVRGVSLVVVVLSEPLTWGILVGFPLVIIGSFLATRRAPAVEAEPHP